MPKTIILAIATLLLAVAALVTDLVRPHAGNIDGSNAAKPAQVQIPARVPVRLEPRELASNTIVYEAI